MNLVVVTGAGASCELGEGSPLPLMAGWCDKLCDALDAAEPNLASAARLSPGMSSEDFEEALGAILRWQELRPLNERFFGLGGSNVGKYPTEIRHAFQRESGRLRTIMATLNRTLYSEFGAGRISIGDAAKAYEWLLFVLKEGGISEKPVFVTTNYDCSIEMAFAELGYLPNTGFIRRPGLSPKLAPEGLVEKLVKAPKEIAVLHLHGAVGWYQKEGNVIEHYADQPYNETMGVPTVLYPDPDKDPTRDAAVQQLWDEFDKALEMATHVLVLGHSLHDAALVQRLAAAEATVGICLNTQDGTFDFGEDEITRLANSLPHAIPIPLRFGPRAFADATRIEAWIAGSREGAHFGM
ncbi:MAG TPA: SIR2 family protein [Solirubrobacterales bacterium]